MRQILICLVLSFFTANLFAEESMESYKVIQKPSMKMIGIECRTSNDPDAGAQDIPMLWQKFFAEQIQSKIPNKVSEEVIALYCDYEGDYTKPYSCVIGCWVSSLDEIPAGMVGKTVPASTFAVYSAVGDYPKSLIETWGHIWGSKLERTYAGDYEVYGSKFASPEKEVEVLIAIEE